MDWWWRIAERLARAILHRRSLRERACRDLDQIRDAVDACAFEYVRGTQAGAVMPIVLPVDTAIETLRALYADGFLEDQELTAVKAFLQPAIQANASLANPPSAGAPGFAGARYVRFLEEGRRLVDNVDSNRMTGRDRAKAAVAMALDRLNR